MGAWQSCHPAWLYARAGRVPGNAQVIKKSLGGRQCCALIIKFDRAAFYIFGGIAMPAANINSRARSWSTQLVARTWSSSWGFRDDTPDGISTESPNIAGPQTNGDNSDLHGRVDYGGSANWGPAVPWALRTDEATGIASATGGTVAPPVGNRRNGGDGSAAPGSLSITSDETDYAPGSTATFTATGVTTGSSVTFRIADLNNAPGVNGVADIYTPFTIKDGSIGDSDGLANGTIVATWQIPADGRATGATLQLTATSNGRTATTTFDDAANKIATENQNAGTPKSVWSIHGSIANQGDSQIEGFATQISTNAGQTVSFKIDTASSGYTLDIYRLGYYSGDGARLVTSMHHTGAVNQPNPLFNDATNTVDAGNWSVSDSWTIPSHGRLGRLLRKADDRQRQFPEYHPVRRPQRRDCLGHSVPDQRHDAGKLTIPGADIICIRVLAVRIAIVPMR